MPKLEPKTVQRELEQGELWPVYWLYGQEKMKSRELLKRIRGTALGERASGVGAAGGIFGLDEQVMDAGEVSSSQVLDAALSPSLGGGLRFIVVRDAHALKEPECLAELMGPRSARTELTSVCVFVSKDLDGRKKFSKLLTEKAAVVPCEEVPEEEKEAWVGYLAKRRGLSLGPEQFAQLRGLDPWSLDIIDQELEKFALAESSPDVLLGSVGAFLGGSETFLDAFFARDLKAALMCAESFAERPDESLPLLGLLGWNVRQLAIVISDRENRTRNAKLNPYLAEKLQRWARGWSLDEILELQSRLSELDFGLKQTPLVPLGLWSDLVMGFCRVR